MKTRTILTALALSMACTSMCMAQDAKKMTIGDEAPDIDIAHWIKGANLMDGRKLKPVTGFGDGNVYVLEFWATWCGPCRAGMPHLSELQERFADYGVTVIGVSDEPLPVVMDFLFQEDKGDGKLQNNRMNYTVCTDPDESVKKDYFRAAGQRGIPCAFVIGKEGHVEWIGHPMRMDEPLEAIVHDNWDRAAFKKQFESAKQGQRQASKLQTELAAAQKAKDWGKTLKALNNIIAANPSAVNYKVQAFMTMIRDMDVPALGYDYGMAMAKDNWDNAMLLNQLAWYTVDTEGIATRNLDFALKLGLRASEIDNNENPAILDTVARVYYEQGELESAVEWQKKAVKFAGDDEMGSSIREMLKKYMQELAGDI